MNRVNSRPASATMIASTGAGAGSSISWGSWANPCAVHLADQFGLRGEVVVEPGHGDPGGVGQLPHADGGGAPLGEEPQRRLDDAVPGGDRGRGTRCRLIAAELT